MLDRLTVAEATIARSDQPRTRIGEVVHVGAQEAPRGSGPQPHSYAQVPAGTRALLERVRLGLAAVDLDLVHVVLDADADALRDRIAADTDDPGAKPWRLDHIDTYLSARGWMTSDADLVIDASTMTPSEAADQILDAIT